MYLKKKVLMIKYNLYILLFAIATSLPLYSEASPKVEKKKSHVLEKKKKKEKKEKEHEGGHTEEEIEEIGIEEDSTDTQESTPEEVIAALQEEEKRKKKEKKEPSIKKTSPTSFILGCNKKRAQKIITFLQSIISPTEEKQTIQEEGDFQYPFGKEKLTALIKRYENQEFEEILEILHQDYLEYAEEIQSIHNCRLFYYAKPHIPELLSIELNQEEEVVYEIFSTIVDQYPNSPFSKMLQTCKDFDLDTNEKNIEFLRTNIPLLVCKYAKQYEGISHKWKDLMDLFKEYSLKYELLGFWENEKLSPIYYHHNSQLALTLQLKDILYKCNGLPLSLKYRIKKGFESYMDFLVYQYNQEYLISLIHEGSRTNDCAEKAFIQLFQEKKL